MEGNLNIERKIKSMVLSRLNKKKTSEEAAKSLGIARNTLRKYQKGFNIEFNVAAGKYECKKMNQ